MTRDEITQANEIWDQHKSAINTIAQIDLCSVDFVQARIWPRISELENSASTDQVRLAFLDNCKHEFADRGYVDFKFSVMIKIGDIWQIPALPILLDLDISSFQGLSININLNVPEEKSNYREQFIAALLPLKHQIKEDPDCWDWKIELGEVELKAEADKFDIDCLVDQLPQALKGVTKRIIEPMALSLAVRP
jgi:hypothetical protein